VLQKIVPPIYVNVLDLSPKAKAIIAVYETLIQALLTNVDVSSVLDPVTLEAFGRQFPIPPFAVIKGLFSSIPDARMRDLLWPLVDPEVVDCDWYTKVHPDVREPVARGNLTNVGEHYRRAGYFERKLPRNGPDPIYG
jgi:hypothetical protein